MEIHPHYGVDQIVLGSHQADVEKQLGAPDRKQRGAFEDDVISEIWDYRLMRLELAFDSDVDYRLARITSNHPHASVLGFNPIGLSESLLLQKYPHLELQLDYGEDGRDYIDRLQDVSYWISDGSVVNVTIFPAYDENANVPRWPKPSRDLTAL